MEDIEKFKHLLEYFVAHQNYVLSKSETTRGYDTYIKPLKDNNSFKGSGQGWKNNNIQNQIKSWEYVNNSKICINIQANYGDYTSRKSYLNWEHTGINIFCEWDNNEVDKLSIGYGYWWCKPTQYVTLMTKSIAELELFNGNYSNYSKEMEDFYNKFTQEIIDYEDDNGVYFQEEQKHYIEQKNKDIMKQTELYLNLLKTNHNLILTGAPGTGKTYLAKQIAQQMIFGEPKENMSEEEKKQFNEQCDFVQFHPSYDYTDFVEGLRPKDCNGTVGFELKKGIFKVFCSKALDVSVRIEKFINDSKANDKEFTLKNGAQFHISEYKDDKINIEQIGTNITATLDKKTLISLFKKDTEIKNVNDIHKIMGRERQSQDDSYIYALYNEFVKTINCVFIIDEINRGEISKIFGELFFSIDPGYRGTKGAVRTQYANMQIDKPNDFDDALSITDSKNFGHFFVPKNVYIIGTMNDIDRSVESMDFAFRRRFAFKEIKATDRIQMLDSLNNKDEAVKRMKNLNDSIEKIEGLSSAYHIGPAYFLKLKNYNGDFDQLWENHIEGLLFEYLRGMTDVYKKLKRLAIAYKYTKADKYE